MCSSVCSRYAQAAEVAQQEAAIQALVASINVRVALCERAAAATEAVDALRAEIEEAENNPSIELRAGKSLLKYGKGPHGKKMEELWQGWDTVRRDARALTHRRSCHFPTLTLPMLDVSMPAMPCHPLLCAYGAPQDHNGVVDIEEICAGLKGVGIEATDEELLALAKSFDVNGNGTLELDELKG